MLVPLLLLLAIIPLSNCDSDYSAEVPGDPDSIPHPRQRPPSLTLGCSLCQQIATRTAATFFTNITRPAHTTHSTDAVAAALNDSYCNHLGIFKKICSKVVANHLDSIIFLLKKNVTSASTVCQDSMVDLCATSTTVCLAYYQDTDNGQVVDPLERLQRRRRFDL